MKKVMLAICLLVIFSGLSIAQTPTINILTHPKYTPADSTTPFALYSVINCTTAYARLRIYDYSGMTTGTDYTWGDTTNAFSGPSFWSLSNAFSYAENIKLILSGGIWAGWLFAKVNGDGADTLSQIRVRFRQQQSTGTILSTNYTDTDSAKHLVMDPSIAGRLYYGGWLKGHVYSDGGFSIPYANIAVLAMRTDSIVGIYVSENNHVDDNYDSTDFGYFRMAVPEGQIDSLKYLDMNNNPVMGYVKTIKPWIITRGLETDLDVTGVSGQPGSNKYSFSLLPCLPNPANKSTKFSFSLSQNGKVELSVFNVLGQKVATLYKGSLASGQHIINWNLKDAQDRFLPNGVYFYQLTDGSRNATRRMLILK